MLTGVTHQKYRLGVVRKLVGEVEVESDTKEEKGEVLDLNKVGLNLICERVGIVILCQTLL